jgi:hypothetical protein
MTNLVKSPIILCVLSTATQITIEWTPKTAQKDYMATLPGIKPRNTQRKEKMKTEN